MISKIPKDKIKCRKCNENFQSMLGFMHHICIADSLKKQVEWRNTPGRSRNKANQVLLYPKWMSEQNKKHQDLIRLKKLEVEDANKKK